MTNHVHALVQTPRPDLGLGYKRIHEEFAWFINKRHGQQGHLFGARFHSRLVSTDRHAVGCLRYIARNPTEAGICSHPQEWPWSAHRALAGLVECPAFLDVSAAYEYLGSSEQHARLNYLRLVASSNNTILGDLARPASDAWLVTAVDDFAIPLAEIGAFLGVGRSTIYRRLSEVRGTEGSVPSVPVGTQGTGP
jgi:hypothetical protein